MSLDAHIQLAAKTDIDRANNARTFLLGAIEGPDFPATYNRAVRYRSYHPRYPRIKFEATGVWNADTGIFPPPSISVCGRLRLKSNGGANDHRDTVWFALDRSCKNRLRGKWPWLLPPHPVVTCNVCPVAGFSEACASCERQQGRKNAAEEGYGHIWKRSTTVIRVCMCVRMSLARIAYTMDRDEATMRS